MGRLTTHVLDTAQGCPAAAVSIELYRVDAQRQLVKKDQTNLDGRLDAPILDAEDFKTGVYELVFQPRPNGIMAPASRSKPDTLVSAALNQISGTAVVSTKRCPCQLRILVRQLSIRQLVLLQQGLLWAQ